MYMVAFMAFTCRTLPLFRELKSLGCEWYAGIHIYVIGAYVLLQRCIKCTDYLVSNNVRHEIERNKVW
jgi:hypothetical protein